MHKCKQHLVSKNTKLGYFETRICIPMKCISTVGIITTSGFPLIAFAHKFALFQKFFPVLRLKNKLKIVSKHGSFFIKIKKW